MPYFKDHYGDLSYPTKSDDGGLYNAQLGAIHSIAAHFTTEQQPALVSMPTGSGKTAVLMMVPFVMQRTRVLVITPSRLVRGQIAEDFTGLETLRVTQVVPDDIARPRVIEVDERIGSMEDWEKLRDYDVVISTPNCVSPSYEGVPTPPADLFDLLLIDEAHHSSAETWKELLASFESTPRVLFTATPFRRDRGEIRGRFVYSYPIARAFADKIFGPISYVEVEPPQGESNDVAVARRTEQVFQADRAAGLNHFVMVRTDRLARATELATVYEANTHLRLKVIHSRLSNAWVKRVLRQLSEGELDGIICVDMMGEGFNFPRLKIAAIHSPHKSLAVTLQFIGRFARTNAPDIGAAKFVAVPTEIDIEGRKLFEKGTVWQEMVPDLSHGRIAQEIRVREAIQEFEEPEESDAELSDLSLYSLYPRSHVKIYSVPDAVDLRTSDVEFGPGVETRYRNANDDGSVMVIITRQRGKPKWSSGDDIIDTEHDLFVVFYDSDTNLLFLNSSRSVDGLYESIQKVVAPTAKPLATGEVGRVVRGINDKRVFNVGMRNILATNTAESYRILAGSDTQAAITASDSRKYRQGHVFLSGEENGARTTVGYSSGSKVWASANNQIPELLDWCRRLGAKIRRVEAVVTNSGLDYLSAGRVVDTIPDHITFVQWHRSAFDVNPPVQIEYTRDDGTQYHGHILDLELQIDRARTTTTRVGVTVTGEGISLPLQFALDDFYSCAAADRDRIQVIRGNTRESLIDYINEAYLDFYTGDGALFSGNELFEPLERAVPIDLAQLEVRDWAIADITSEVDDTATGISVQNYVRGVLVQANAGVVIFDHGKGEVADYIAVTESQNTIVVSLYHCKGSGGPLPGARVDDLYDVCGQAQKSVALGSLDKLARRLRQRTNKQFVRGDQNTLNDLLNRARDMRHRFEIVIVQPGISSRGLSQAMAENLGATNGHLVGAGIDKLRVWASA